MKFFTILIKVSKMRTCYFRTIPHPLKEGKSVSIFERSVYALNNFCKRRIPLMAVHNLRLPLAVDSMPSFHQFYLLKLQWSPVENDRTQLGSVSKYFDQNQLFNPSLIECICQQTLQKKKNRLNTIPKINYLISI